jgi:hypothetical protein
MTPSHAQEIFGRAGRATGASRINTSVVDTTFYGTGVGISTPTVVIQPSVISFLAAES